MRVIGSLGSWESYKGCLAKIIRVANEGPAALPASHFSVRQCRD